MKRVFLDENVDLALAPLLTSCLVETARSAGYLGKANGELIELVQGSFDVLVSHDRGLEFQHNWTQKTIALVVLMSRFTQLSHYVSRIDEVLDAIQSTPPGTVRRVNL